MTRAVRAGLIAVGLAVAGVGVWYARPRPAVPSPDTPPAAEASPDPRLVLDSPYRNVRPGVRYLGDAACAGCHPDIDRTYHQHPMGRSAAYTARAVPVERYDAAANNPAVGQGFALRVVRDGAAVRHVMTAAGGPADQAYTVAADVAIGSGTRGRSYLSVEGGAVWQSPLSWFGHAGRWDVSPGFALPDAARREVVADCLFCHTDRAEPVPGATNRYREPLFPVQPHVGCERCHGPGELHAAERAAGQPAATPDTAIVNPKHLPPDLRAAVCQQCHLQGAVRFARPGRGAFDFRPGLPLEPFLAVFARHPGLAGDLRSVGQFEQMAASKCSTGGALGCTSCHDPHAKPEPAAAGAFYRARCLACHDAGRGCSLPAADRAAKADACAACHMPRAGSGNIAHTAVTDHRVPRRPGGPPAARRLPADADPVVPALAGPHAPPPADRERDLAVALAWAAVQPPADLVPYRSLMLPAAARRLDAVVRDRPADAEAWALRAFLPPAGTGDRRPFEAAVAAAGLAPESDAALAAFVNAATAAGVYDRAARAAGTLIDRNPTAVRPRLARAIARLRLGDAAGAEADCRAALAVQPVHAGAWEWLAEARRAQGDPAGARAAAAAAAGLAADPATRARLLARFD
jgi:predicted CXXCH cytochrome family protein